MVGAGSCRADPPMARPEAAPAINVSNGSIVNYGETLCYREQPASSWERGLAARDGRSGVSPRRFTHGAAGGRSAPSASTGVLSTTVKRFTTASRRRLPGSAGFQPAKVGAGSCRANPPMARPEAAPAKKASNGSIINYGEMLCYREPPASSWERGLPAREGRSGVLPRRSTHGAAGGRTHKKCR